MFRTTRFNGAKLLSEDYPTRLQVLEWLNTIFYMPREEVENRFTKYFYEYFQSIFECPSSFPLYSEFCNHIFDVTNAGGKRVLDVGCGFGLISIHFGVFGSQRVVGTDLDADKIHVFQKLLELLHISNVEPKLGDILDLEVSERFDVAICNEVISHVRNFELCLERIYRCLEHGGVLYISDCNNSLNLLHKKEMAKRLSKQGVKPFSQGSSAGQFAERQFNPLVVVKELDSFGFEARLLRPFFVSQHKRYIGRVCKKVASEVLRFFHPISIVVSPKFEIVAIKS